jgi:hypothetical protein
LAPPFNWGQQQQVQQFIQNLWCPLPLMDLFLVRGHLRCVPLILVLPGRSIEANHLRHWHLLMTLGRCRWSVLRGAFVMGFVAIDTSILPSSSDWKKATVDRTEKKVQPLDNQIRKMGIVTWQQTHL